MATIFDELTDLTGRVEILTTRPAFDGTYSNVYRGKYNDQTVAVKVLKSIGRTHAMRRKILRERGIWGAFNHPNILPLIGYAEGDERFEPFGALVSPWCINGDAAGFLEEHGPSLSLAQRIALWEGVVKGVDYLHHFNPTVVHGDLKPANVLLDWSGNPLICDFGLARLILEEGGTGTTTTTAHTGTERYLAYELVVSDDIITPTVASDIHALGCIGLDFIFLQRPYSHRKNNAHGHIYFDIRQRIPPATHPESLSRLEETFWNIIVSCWNLDSAGRPATGAILAALHTATSRPAASLQATDPLSPPKSKLSLSSQLPTPDIGALPRMMGSGSSNSSSSSLNGNSLAGAAGADGGSIPKLTFPKLTFAPKREAIRLPEESDAEMARRWEFQSQIAASSTIAVEAHGRTNATHQNLETDLPEYDDVYEQQLQSRHRPNHSIDGSGPGLTYLNHFPPPQQEAEAVPSSQPTVPAGRPLSWGGGNPNRTSKPPKHSTHFQGPGYVTNSASMSSFPPLANVGNARLPPNQAGISQPSSYSVNSPPGARSPSQPLTSTFSSTPPPLSNVTRLGISFPNTDSLSGILHGYGCPILHEQPLPTATPVREVVKMEPEPSPPFFIVAPTWKILIKFIASQSNTRVEPSPAALAREKHGPPNLRVVLHFIKLPNGDHRVIMYLAVQSTVPPPGFYPVTDTRVVPYLFPNPYNFSYLSQPMPPDPLLPSEPGRPLENLPEAQLYSIPTQPLPQLPALLSNLAPYLQAALDESTGSRDSRSRLQKLIQATTVTTHSTSHIATALITGSSGSRYESEGNPIKVAESSGSTRSFFARVFRPRSSGDAGNKSLNNENYDVITPFTMGDYS
ncbi:hypothetical protein FRC17_010756 [Serendipita sp. 399]|nr:hypothetical protein FRC17_010756 [Serendipita sp. 399]